MSLDDLVSVNVRATDQTPTRTGFGTPLFACFHQHNADRVRSYTSLAAMATDGFLPTDPAYRMAQAAWSQNPRPPRIKIGRRALPTTQVVSLTPATPVSSSASEVYAVKIEGVACSFTSDATPTVSEVCTGLAAAINTALGASASAILATGGASSGSSQSLNAGALNGSLGSGPYTPARRLSVTFDSSSDWTTGAITITGVDDGNNAISESFAVSASSMVNGSKLFSRVGAIAIPAQGGTGGTFTIGVRAVVEAVATGGTHIVTTGSFSGEVHAYEHVTGNVAFADTSSDPGIATDLAAIAVADGDWYGLAIDSNSAAEIAATAAWVESNRKLFVAQTADANAADPSSHDDVLRTLEHASYARTSAWFYPAVAATSGWLAAGILGNRLPVDPGSDTWAYKTIAGVSALAVSDTQHGAVLAKKANTYEVVAGIAITFPGKVSDDEWVDVVRGLDWFRARLQERLFGLLAGAAKIPFTDNGIDLVRSAVLAQLKEGIRVSLFDGAVKPTISAPAASAVDSTDRSNRNLPSVTFSARLAGAIHTVDVTGTASA